MIIKVQSRTLIIQYFSDTFFHSKMGRLRVLWAGKSGNSKNKFVTYRAFCWDRHCAGPDSHRPSFSSRLWPRPWRRSSAVEFVVLSHFYHHPRHLQHSRLHCLMSRGRLAVGDSPPRVYTVHHNLWIKKNTITLLISLFGISWKMIGVTSLRDIQN